MSLQRILQCCFLFFLLAATALNGNAQLTDTGVQVVEAPATDTSYSDEDYEEEEVMDTLLSSNIIYFPKDSLQALLQQKEFSYIANLDSLLKKAQDEELKRLQSKKPAVGLFWIFYILRLLLWFIVIGAVAYLIYRLFLSQKGIFAASVKNKHAGIEEEEFIDEDVLARKTREAELAGNYRLAVRYYYLHTLSMISQKGWLQLSPDKTNYQYVRELSNRSIKNEFARITLHYEYAWYGNFEVDEAIFKTIKKEFLIFQTTVKQA